MLSRLAVSSLLLPAVLAKGLLKSQPVEGGLCDATVKSQSGKAMWIIIYIYIYCIMYYIFLIYIPVVII
jgi:hypothetical protein